MTGNVKAGEVSYLDARLDMQRLTPPEVVNYSPKVEEGELVECSSKIVLSLIGMWIQNLQYKHFPLLRM